MINLKGASDTNTFETKNRTVRRLSVVVRLALNSGGTASLPSLENVVLKCTLHRNGQKHIIFQDSLRLLAIESMFFGSIEQLQQASYMTLMADGVVAPPRIYGQQLMIDIGSPINVKGSDVLTLEASATNGWLTGSASTSTYISSSSIEFNWRDDIGVETFIPKIVSQYIPAQQEKFKHEMGDNVTSIAVINVEGQPPAGYVNDANAIIRHLSVNSDRYTMSDTIDRMLARRSVQFPMQNQSWWRGHSFYIDLNGEIDAASIELSLNAANVNTSKNAIVYRTYIIDAHTVHRAARMQAGHEAKNTEKVQQHLSKTP